MKYRIFQPKDGNIWNIGYRIEVKNRDALASTMDTRKALSHMQETGAHSQHPRRFAHKGKTGSFLSSQPPRPDRTIGWIGPGFL